MGKKLKGALSVTFALTTALAMGACGSKPQADAGDAKTDQVQVAEASTSMY